MRLAIITINYNTSFETIEMLKSLKSQTDQNFEVIVLDNASSKSEFDELDNYIREDYSGVFFISQVENLGFSGGNNSGIKKALSPSTDSGPSGGAEWVLLLNNDTWLEKDFIARLRPILAQKQGVIGLPIREGKHVVYGGHLMWLRETLPHNLRPATDGSRDYAIGGAMAIHRSVFDKVGYLDENYFLYFEDADFSLRVRKKNIPIEIVTDPIVNHATSVSAKKLGRPKLLYYHYRNALRFNFHHGPGLIKLLVPFWSLWVIAKQILKITLGIKAEESRYILGGVFDFYRGRFGKH